MRCSCLLYVRSMKSSHAHTCTLSSLSLPTFASLVPTQLYLVYTSLYYVVGATLRGAVVPRARSATVLSSEYCYATMVSILRTFHNVSATPTVELGYVLGTCVRPSTFHCHLRWYVHPPYLRLYTLRYRAVQLYDRIRTNYHLSFMRTVAPCALAAADPWGGVGHG